MSDFKNLTVDYRQILQRASVSDRVKVANSSLAQDILSRMSPSEIARLFPKYYRDSIPAVKQAYYGNYTTGASSYSSSSSSSTASTYSAPSSTGKIDAPINIGPNNNKPAWFNKIMGEGQPTTNSNIRYRDAKIPTNIANIINKHAQAAGIDPAFARRIAQIESSGNPNNTTGSYKGLFQLSNSEFKKYGGKGSIYDPEENARVALIKMASEKKQLAKMMGREVTDSELYLAHQQGLGGASKHLQNPNQPAWQSMYQTGEGKKRGAAWAKRAIWGNVPNDLKKQYGSVDNITSQQFTELWRNKIVEPDPFGVQNENPSDTGKIMPTTTLQPTDKLMSDGTEEKKARLKRSRITQSQGGKIRDKPISSQLDKVLNYAAEQAGVEVDVTSGGQARKGTSGKRTGSTRHDDGQAADIDLYITDKDGNRRRLDFKNDQEVFEKFVTAAAAAGATGIGGGKGYMDRGFPNGGRIHVGFGTPLVWGAGGKSANAPEWLKNAHKLGIENPIDLNKSAVPALPDELPQAVRDEISKLSVEDQEALRAKLNDLGSTGINTITQAIAESPSAAANVVEAVQSATPAQMEKIASGQLNIIDDTAEMGNYGSKAEKKPYEYIGVHYTGAESLESAKNWAKQSNEGYQYLIDKDGSVHMVQDPDKGRSNHWGKRNISKAKNNNSVGISYVGSSGTATPEQIAAGVALTEQVAKKYNIPYKNVYGHGETTENHRSGNEGYDILGPFRQKHNVQPDIPSKGGQRAWKKYLDNQTTPQEKEIVPIQERGLTNWLGMNSDPAAIMPEQNQTGKINPDLGAFGPITDPQSATEAVPVPVPVPTAPQITAPVAPSNPASSQSTTGPTAEPIKPEPKTSPKVDIPEIKAVDPYKSAPEVPMMKTGGEVQASGEEFSIVDNNSNRKLGEVSRGENIKFNAKGRVEVTPDQRIDPRALEQQQKVQQAKADNTPKSEPKPQATMMQGMKETKPNLNYYSQHEQWGHTETPTSYIRAMAQAKGRRHEGIYPGSRHGEEQLSAL